MANKNLFIILGAIGIGLLAVLLYEMLFAETEPELGHSSNKTPISITQSENSDLELENVTAPQTIEEDEFITEELAEQLQWVAEAFEEQSRYPSYSLVIEDLELAMPKAPFEQAEVEMKLFDPSGNLLDISIFASVDKFNYVMGEAITVRLLINGADASEVMLPQVNLKQSQDSKDLSERVYMDATNPSNSEFKATFDSDDLSIKGSSQELFAKIELELDGRQYVTTVPFYLSKAAASIEGLGASEQVEDHLLIPLEFDVYESGYYFVRAYLDDARTNRPLLSLQSEGRLSKGSAELRLKAHQQALKDAGSEGPYKLRISHAFRGAEDDELADVQVSVSQKAFDIPDFSFDGYADTPFSDPLIDEQLQLLKKLAGKG